MGYRAGKLNSVQPRNILIVGNNSLGQELEKLVLAYQGLGLCVVGFIDDEIPNPVQDKKVLGCLANICQVVDKWRVDDVVIALPPARMTRFCMPYQT
jgi:AmiR/NasT family two-component response regulator